LTDPRYGFGGSYTLVRGFFDLSADYWEHNLEGHAKRVLTPTVTATLAGQFTQHDAEQAQGEDFRIGRVVAGGEWAFSPDGSLSGQAGASVFAPQGSETTVRPSVLALWTQRFLYFSLSASYSSGFQADFQSVDSTGVSFVQSASVYLRSLAFRDLAGTVGVRWNRQEFEQSSTSRVGGTTESTWDLEARLEYILARPLVLTLGYIYTIRSSTDPTAAFVENRVRLGLTYRYDLF
ncbi:MAG TPA: outer membrane beta-barrel protein, partial [Candidatus Methylomirabilis sp.]|nr:outer membrane beta-barrel protein [Candidatus Methylomirabilis sp.]